jgi:tripartite-type tricarboxylate transporter receptor subunit TctC
MAPIACHNARIAVSILRNDNKEETMRLRLSFVVWALMSATIAVPALAETFPDKPIRFIVPFPAGGGNDITARALAEGMIKDLGQQVVLEFKPGAGTMIGTEYALSRPADGYTILMGSFAHSVNPVLVKKLTYDPAKVGHVAMVGRYSNLVVVHPDRPYKTMKELLAHAKANPGKLNYGSFGNGTSAHMFAELLKSMQKLDIIHVPYKGAAPAVIDTLGGRLDMLFATSTSATPHIRSGKLRHLAVTSLNRSPFYPDIPTIAESGVPGYDGVAWYGVLTTAGTPPDRIARLSKAVQASARSPAFRELAKKNGVELDVGGPEKLAAFMKGEQARWAKVIESWSAKPK